jgi:hypothetical protein
MGRLRARLAGNEIDRELKSCLAEAERHLERALAVCRRVAKTEHLSSRKALNAAKVVGSSLSAIRSIGSLVPSIDVSDPDLTKPTEESERGSFRS